MNYSSSLFTDGKIRLLIKHPTMKLETISELLDMKPNVSNLLINCEKCRYFYRAGAKGLACKKKHFEVYHLKGCKDFENRHWEYMTPYKEWSPYDPVADLKTFIEEKLPDDQTWRKITNKGSVTITLHGRDDMLAFKDIEPDEFGDRKFEYTGIIEIPVELSRLLSRKKIHVVFDQSFEIGDI
jgi:hypothetical protein